MEPMPTANAAEVVVGDEGSLDSQFMSLYSDRGDLDQPAVRRQTYLLWPAWAPSSVDTGILAAAGLYYTGEADIVRCYACRQQFGDWKDGDDPVDVHRRRAPGCPVVRALRDAPSPPPSPPSYQRDLELASAKLANINCSSGRVDKKWPVEDCVDVGTMSGASCCQQSSRLAMKQKMAKPDKIKLREENRRLQADFVCRRCKNNKVQVLFLPCRHLVTCQKCADDVDDCVRCGQRILGTVRTYLL